MPRVSIGRSTKLAPRRVLERVGIDQGLEEAAARRDIARELRVEVGIAQADPQLALGRVDLRALVDRAVERDHELHPIAIRAAHADPRVLQLEAVIAPDELHVRIVLHDHVLQAQVAERLPREPRIGRRWLRGFRWRRSRRGGLGGSWRRRCLWLGDDDAGTEQRHRDDCAAHTLVHTHSYHAVPRRECDRRAR